MHSSFRVQISMASITNILPQFCFGTLLVVTIFLALAEASVRKCSRPQKYGNLPVDYPFGIHPSACIAHPGFEITCKENFSLGRGLLPFLPTPSGDFQILNISNGTLIINSTSLKAMSCNGTDDAWKDLQLPKDGPFTISEQNVFAVIGCRSIGSFMNAQGEGGYCKAACLNQNETKYCNWYGYCAAGIPGNWQWINFTGGGICYLNFENCGFSTILEPETFSPTHPGWIGSGEYNLKLDWAIGNLNCSNMQFAQTRVEDIFATVKRLTKETAIPMALDIKRYTEDSYNCSCAERKGDGVNYCVKIAR